MRKGTIVLVLAVLVGFLAAVSRLEAGHREQGCRQLEEAARRAAVSCYAREGFYPPDVAYMCRNYALRYDPQVYAVGYTLYASNLMPDITVLELQP